MVCNECKQETIKLFSAIVDNKTMVGCFNCILKGGI